MGAEYKRLVRRFKNINLSTEKLQDEKFEINKKVVKALLRLEVIYPDTWSMSAPSKGYRLKKIPWFSPEYKQVSNKFHKTLPQVNIIKIVRVENPWLYAQFYLKKIHKKKVHGHVKTHSLFHGTSSSNIDSICKNNFDWRMVGKSGYLGCKYGRGVAFSPKASYASDYPRGCYEEPRVMFVAKVLEVKSCTGCVGMKIPPRNCDTSKRPNGDVVVKYSDNEFYPEYIIYYELD